MQAEPRRVIVVGSVNIDLVVAGARLPAPGETVLGGTFGRFHGGKGGNQAVAAARLDARVAFVGGVGRDAFGEEARAALVRERIDDATLASLDGVATGVALILVDERGENLISVAPGANGAVTPAMVREALMTLRVASADVVLVGHEIPTASVRAALDEARGAGARTILNPAPAGGLDVELLAAADILTPNRGELRDLVALLRSPTRRVDLTGAAPGLSQTTEPDALARAARALSEATGAAVVVSLGRDGALLVVGGQPVVTLAAPRVEAVDATGAGDALNGALAAGLAAGLEIREAAGRAVVAASLSVRRAGAREGMPTTAELDAKTAR